MAKEKKTASMKRDDQVEGGGLLDNVDTVWTECEFVMWDYNGTINQAVPALRIAMDVTDEEGEESEAEQYFSAGKADDWEPSEDGSELEAVGKAAGLNKSSNLIILINSLIDAGFPEDKVEGDCKVFEGLDCHMVRVPAPKRTGLTRRKRDDGREFDPTNLVVDAINKLPWEKKGGKGKAAKTGKDKAAKAEPEDDAVSDEAQAVLLGVLTEADGPLAKKKAASLAFKELKDNPNKNAIVQLLYSDEFLGRDDHPWSYKDGNLSLS